MSLTDLEFSDLLLRQVDLWQLLLEIKFCRLPYFDLNSLQKYLDPSGHLSNNAVFSLLRLVVVNHPAVTSGMSSMSNLEAR